MRLRILEKRVDKCQKHVDAKTKAVEELDERIKSLQAERDEQNAALTAAAKELDDARAERTAELQRAIEEESKGGGFPAAAPEVDGTAAGKALGILVTETRARLPGAGEEVARAVESAMGQLVALLAQLPFAPSAPPAAESAAAPVAGAGGGPNPPNYIDRQKAAADAAAATDQQRAVAAAAREAAQEAAQAAAADAAEGPKPADGNGDDLRSEISDEESDGEESICQMQLDRQENETEQERNARVSKMLKERAKAKKARRAERREGRKDKLGGVSARRVREPTTKGAA